MADRQLLSVSTTPSRDISNRIRLPTVPSPSCKESTRASPKVIPPRGCVALRLVNSTLDEDIRGAIDVLSLEIKLWTTNFHDFALRTTPEEKETLNMQLLVDTIEALQHQGCKLCPATEDAGLVSKSVTINSVEQDQDSSKPLLFLLVAGIYRASSPGSGELTARLRKNNVSYFKRTIALYRQLIGTIVSFVRPLPGMSMSELSFRFPEGAKEQLERAARIDFFGEGDRKSHSFVSLMSAEECRLWASEQQSMPRYSDQAEMGLHSDSVFVVISTVTKDTTIVKRIESLCEAKETEKAFAKTLEMYSRYKHSPITLRFAYPITELPYSEFTQWSSEEQEGLRFAWIEDVLERCCVPLERRELSVLLTDCNGAQRWASCENEIVNPLCPSAKCNYQLVFVCASLCSYFLEPPYELVKSLFGTVPFLPLESSALFPRTARLLLRRCIIESASIVFFVPLCGLRFERFAALREEEKKFLIELAQSDVRASVGEKVLPLVDVEVTCCKSNDEKAARNSLAMNRACVSSEVCNECTLLSVVASSKVANGKPPRKELERIAKDVIGFPPFVMAQEPLPRVQQFIRETVESEPQASEYMNVPFAVVLDDVSFVDFFSLTEQERTHFCSVLCKEIEPHLTEFVHSSDDVVIDLEETDEGELQLVITVFTLRAHAASLKGSLTSFLNGELQQEPLEKSLSLYHDMLNRKMEAPAIFGFIKEPDHDYSPSPMRTQPPLPQLSSRNASPATKAQLGPARNDEGLAKQIRALLQTRKVFAT